MSTNTDNDNRASPEARVLAPAEHTIQPAPGDELSKDLLAPWSTQVPGSPVRRVTLAQLLRHKWLAIAVFLVFAVPTGAAVWFLHEPKYGARGAIIVEPRKRIAYRTDDNSGAVRYRQRRNDQAALLRDPLVLNRVLDRHEIKQTRWYNETPMFALGGPPSPLERLRNELSLSLPRDSSFIYVEITCRDPGEAALIVNAVIDEYVQFARHQFSEDDDILLDALEEDLERLFLEKRANADAIADLLESSGLYTESPDALVQQIRLRLDTKEAELRQLQREILIITRRLKPEIAAQSPSSQPDDEPAASQPARRTIYAAYPEWRQVNEELRLAKHAVEVAERSGHLGGHHTDMIALRANVECLQEQLAVREAELDDLAPTASRTSAGPAQAVVTESLPVIASEPYLQDLKVQAEVLESEIEQERARLKATANAVRELEAQKEELQRVESQRAVLRERAIAYETERDAPPSIKPRPAATPSQPGNTRRRYMLMAMALFGSATLALAAAYLRASTSQAVCEAADVLEPTETPFLGYLPLVRDPGHMTSHEAAHQAECVRIARTMLLERVNGLRSTAMLVTSAGPRAGKTTVAMLTAESLAKCGKRVLLVDADLQNPSLSRRCEAAAKPGLTDLLTGRAVDTDAIAATQIRGLDVLPAGTPGATHDPELLANGTLATSVQRWRERYDVIVLDSPPVISAADARILARQVDGTVLVAREGHCRRDDVIEALAVIGASGGRLLGTVFVGSRRGGYGRYYSHYYRRDRDGSEVDTANPLDAQDS